jgi:hypothetical protein
MNPEMEPAVVPHAANDELGTITITASQFRKLSDIAPARAFNGAKWKEKINGRWCLHLVKSVRPATMLDGQSVEIIDGSTFYIAVEG